MLSWLPKAAQLSLAVSLFYAACSVSLSMLNKAILSSYRFDCYFLLLAAQLLLSLGFCTVSRDIFGNPFNIPKFDFELAKSALPMGIMYVGNVAVGMIGLQMVNVPMFFCLRRLVAPMVLLYEFLVLGKTADVKIQGAISVIVMGTVLAGWDALSADLLGYAITLLNNVFSAAGSVMQKQYSEKTKISTFGIVYYNALIAAPLTVVLAIFTGELAKYQSFAYKDDSGFWFGFIISSGMGLLLTYSSMLSTTYNSPLATSVTGNAKDILTTSIGWMLFPGFAATVKSVGGILLSFCGAFLYSYVNLQKHRAHQPTVNPPNVADNEEEIIVAKPDWDDMEAGKTSNDVQLTSRQDAPADARRREV